MLNCINVFVFSSKCLRRGLWRMRRSASRLGSFDVRHELHDLMRAAAQHLWRRKDQRVVLQSDAKRRLCAKSPCSLPAACVVLWSICSTAIPHTACPPQSALQAVTLFVRWAYCSAAE